MSHSVNGTTITLTRGDSFIAEIGAFKDKNKTIPYVPATGDKVRFALKTDYSSKSQVLIKKDIPINTMRLVINPADTKDLDYGEYVYDVELTTASGLVDTFITKAKFKITEEVD